MNKLVQGIKSETWFACRSLRTVISLLPFVVIYLHFSSVNAQIAEVSDTRPEELFGEDQRGEWSYEFMDTKKTARISLYDTPGEVVYADEDWVVKELRHPADIAGKTRFNLYFHDAKTLDLVNIFRAPNILQKITCMRDGETFVLLTNSPGKPHYTLGNPRALVLIDPRARLMEKVDLSEDPSADAMLDMVVTEKTIRIQHDPRKADEYLSPIFRTKRFSAIKVVLLPEPGKKTCDWFEQNWPASLHEGKAKSAKTMWDKAGLTFLGNFTHRQIDVDSLASNREDAIRFHAQVNIGFCDRSTPLAGLNMIQRLPDGQVKLLNLRDLRNHILGDAGIDFSNIGLFQDGTVRGETKDSVILIQENKSRKIEKSTSEVIFGKTDIVFVPQQRVFGETWENPDNPDSGGKNRQLPLNIAPEVTRITSDGDSTRALIAPITLQKRLLPDADSLGGASIWSYRWDYNPRTDETILSERELGSEQATSYTVTGGREDVKIPNISLNLGHPLVDLQVGNSDGGWRVFSVIGNAYNVFTTHDIFAVDSSGDRVSPLYLNLPGRPGLLWLKSISADKVQVLFSFGDTIKLLSFNPGADQDKSPNKVEGPSIKTPPTESMPVQSTREWKAASPVLPSLFSEETNWLFVPNINSYTAFKLFSDPEPRKEFEIYFSGEEYAIVLPNGFYAGSPGCEVTLLKQISVGGLDATSLAQWRNRPAEVLTALGGDPSQIAVLSKVTERWLNRLGNPEKMPEPHFSDVPSLLLQSEVPLWAEKDEVDLRFTVTPGNAPVHKVVLRVNGVTCKEEPQATGNGSHVQSKAILAEGQNWIEAVAIDTMGHTSNVVRFRTILRKAGRQSKRFIISLGVSKYQRSELNLALAAKDASDVLNVFKELKSSAATETLLLLDQEVGWDVVDKVREFSAQATENDEIILFCAGHGMLDENLNYVFAGHDFDPEQPSVTGIKLDDLLDAINEGKSLKRLVLLDTCQSGLVGEKDEILLADKDTKLPSGVRAIKHRGMTVLPNAVLSASEKQRFIEELYLLPGLRRGISIIGASGGAEYALESSKWNNGVFTSSLIEALGEQRADLNNDNKITVSEVKNYLGYRVPELTSGLQRPSVVAFERDQDFELLKAAHSGPVDTVNDVSPVSHLNSNQRLEASIENLTRTFFNAIENADEPAISNCLADRVDYYSSGPTSKANVVADIRDDWKRYNRRKYRISEFVSDSASSGHFLLSYDLLEGEKPRRGKLRISITLSKSSIPRIEKLTAKVATKK